ncbi:hypothetical protein DCS_04496 [Drechmeria coniospora]|uniref:Uncharacterized protein n=1 Tax=Drechmeria coniospora TaxID=98403 RepID=A0A151GK68_DRECN|nr:hypothetical protein DCS_04496 [Drechmeria coniospora]KYK57486.1 hypothetical protein DCS_04496 [Drechmeria coniospora]
MEISADGHATAPQISFQNHQTEPVFHVRPTCQFPTCAIDQRANRTAILAKGTTPYAMPEFGIVVGGELKFDRFHGHHSVRPIVTSSTSGVICALAPELPGTTITPVWSHRHAGVEQRVGKSRWGVGKIVMCCVRTRS